MDPHEIRRLAVPRPRSLRHKALVTGGLAAAGLAVVWSAAESACACGWACGPCIALAFAGWIGLGLWLQAGPLERREGWLHQELTRIARQVDTQQDRLVRLLRELQQAMSQQSQLAGLQQELEVARSMQQSILPRQPPAAAGVEVAALMIPAREVGGDFYDYFLLDEEHLAVLVADVSGKGIPAALFMAISRTLFKSHALFLREPAQVMSRLNDQLCAENEQMMFVTAFFAVLNLRSGTLDFVNAGHNPPVVHGRRGGARLIDCSQNMALAVLEGRAFQAGRLHLQPGDILLLYTDGITEAHDPAGRLFGEARLLDAVAAHPQVQDLPLALVDRVRRFEAGVAPSDDITCVALRYAPAATTALCA